MTIYLYIASLRFLHIRRFINRQHYITLHYIICTDATLSRQSFDESMKMFFHYADHRVRWPFCPSCWRLPTFRLSCQFSSSARRSLVRLYILLPILHQSFRSPACHALLQSINAQSLHFMPVSLPVCPSLNMHLFLHQFPVNALLLAAPSTQSIYYTRYIILFLCRDIYYVICCST